MKPLSSDRTESIAKEIPNKTCWNNGDILAMLLSSDGHNHLRVSHLRFAPAIPPQGKGPVPSPDPKDGTGPVVGAEEETDVGSASFPVRNSPPHHIEVLDAF